METLKPKLWLSAHLHVHFETEVQFNDGSKVKFSALDKPTGSKSRTFAKILELGNEKCGDSEAEFEMSFDSEWL